MKILFLADGIYPFVPGGMQKHSYEMVRGFLHAGIGVHLIHYVKAGQKPVSPKELAEAFHLSSIAVELFSQTCITYPEAGKLPGHYLREQRKFSQWAFHEVHSLLPRFDLIYAQGFTGYAFIKAKSREKKVPPIGVHFHGLNMFQQIPPGIKNKIVARLFQREVRWILRHADVILGYEGKIKQLIGKIAGSTKPFIHQPIGIHIEEISTHPLSTGKGRRFIFVGRNDRVKGLPELLQAFEVVKDAELIIIGDATVQSVNSNVVSKGRLSDEELKSELRNSDVLVLPSFSEGMPFVVLEAMGMGLAILATDVGANAIMVDSTNGKLIEPGNIKQLENSLLFFREMDDSLLNQMKIHSREKAKNLFSWQHIISESVEQFNALPNTIKPPASKEN